MTDVKNTISEDTHQIDFWSQFIRYGSKINLVVCYVNCNALQYTATHCNINNDFGTISNKTKVFGFGTMWLVMSTETLNMAIMTGNMSRA